MVHIFENIVIISFAIYNLVVTSSYAIYEFKNNKNIFGSILIFTSSIFSLVLVSITLFIR